ncbi:TPA: hypothetical protein DCE37_23430 [Candidatus Latescibacteria bacterium]|nr:hypothetical protein [Candidatus Latescibacterota bacterium]
MAVAALRRFAVSLLRRSPPTPQSTVPIPTPATLQALLKSGVASGRSTDPNPLSPAHAIVDSTPISLAIGGILIPTCMISPLYWVNFSDPIHHTPHLQHGQPRMIDRSNGHAYHRRVTIADADRIDRLRTRMSDLDPLASPKAVFIREPNQSGRSLILDASFNPPTLAHRALAESAAEAANASSILLQLSVANVDKTVTSADLGQRLFMLELMAQGHDHVGITGCSHARFIDKAVAIRELSPGLHPIFAIGYDTLVRLFDEKYYEDMMGDLEALFSQAEIAVANRADVDVDELADYLAQPPQASFRYRIHPVALPPRFADVSSSAVRERLATGSDVSDAVPPVILPFLDESRLYT